MSNNPKLSSGFGWDLNEYRPREYKIEMREGVNEYGERVIKPTRTPVQSPTRARALDFFKRFINKCFHNQNNVSIFVPSKLKNHEDRQHQLNCADEQNGH